MQEGLRGSTGIVGSANLAIYSNGWCHRLASSKMTDVTMSRQMVVMAALSSRTQGLLRCGNLAFRCAIGRGGIVADKREGDGASPRGSYGVSRVLYRSDRIRRPRSGLPVRAIRRDDGWADEACDRNYNRPVRHPYRASAERLWREDGLYDLVVTTSHNVCPRVKGRGSAIFIHVARDGFAPTEGCVALRLADLEKLVAVMRPGMRIVIGR